jgi:phospholipid N-methyltransferase
VNGSAADLTRILAERDIDDVDAIVCGLPWATLPVSLQQAVFAAMDRALVPGGVFVTFGYFQSLVMPAAQALRRRLLREFPDVRRSPVVWANVPPAFAYICRKREQAFLAPGGHPVAGRLQEI